MGGVAARTDTEVKPVQPANASLPTLATEAGNSSAVKAVPANALSPIDSTASGR